MVVAYGVTSGINPCSLHIYGNSSPWQYSVCLLRLDPDHSRPFPLRTPVGALGDPNMSQKSASSLKPRLEAATRTYQDLQDDLEKAVASRAKLEAQLLETENVKKVYSPPRFLLSCIAFGLLE